MRLKTAFVALSLSLASLFSSTAARAAGIGIGTDYFMTVEPYSSGENNGSFYVGYTTIYIYADNNGVQGAQLDEFQDAYCVDFVDEISVPTTYLVIAQGIGSNFDSAITNTTDAGGNTQLKLEAALGEQFNGNNANDSAVQEAIWDQTGATYADTGAVATALSNAATYEAATNPAPNYSQDIDFERVSGGQSFMVDNSGVTLGAPPPVPEPTPLFLLGTGMLGMVAIMRHKLAKAELHPTK